MTDILSSGALLSECQRYRYKLWRTWSAEGNRRVAFVMLNPSTADAAEDDPTIRKCIKYGRAWGFDGLDVVNLFAWRETDSRLLPGVISPVGPANDAAIVEVTKAAELVVCAWGKHGMLMNRSRTVAAMLAERGIDLTCLATNLDRSPVHPLYQRDDAKPVAFSAKGIR